MLLIVSPAVADEAVTLAGKRTAGRLVRVTADAVSLSGPAGTVPVRELSAVELSAGPPLPADARYDEIELTDGSTLRVTGLKVVADKVLVEPLPAAGAPAVELPMRAVAWVLRNAHEPKNRTDWTTLLAARGKRDLIVFRQAAGGLMTLPGTVIDGSPAGDRLTFEREDGQRSAVPLTRATGGLVFNQPPSATVPPTVCRVLDAGGNTWVAAAVDATSDGLTVTTPAGAVVRYPTRGSVRSLDFNRGNVAYLADLALETTYPPAERFGPLSDRFPYAPVVVADATNRSLTVPADATLTAPIGEGFRTFRAVLAVPDTAPADAAFTVAFEADGRPLQTLTAKAGDPPREVSVSVADARQLRVRVTRGRVYAGDRVLLADARFQK